VTLSASKRVAALAVAALAVIAAVAACEGSGSKGATVDGGGAAGAPSSASADPASSDAGPQGTAALAAEDPNSDVPDGWDGSTTVPPDTSTTIAPLPVVPLGRTLRQGISGDDVKLLQERLKQLAFDPGDADGQFGSLTTSAVWAFEKLVLNRKATGKISPDDWNVLFGNVQIAPRRTNSTLTHLEVYLPQQVAVLFKNNVPELVTHISTGDGKEWCSDKAARCGLSITPGGVYHFYRRQSDWWEGSLGRMFNPVYFNYGIAVHGMTSVPNYPASHGCVRIPMHIAQYFPDLVRKGDMVYVWDGKKEPEAYGAQPPPFDRPDPNATTTTIAPPTTKAAPTTTKAPTTPAPTKAPTTVPPPTTPPTTPPPATTAAPPTQPPSSGG
jgi:hypothetical protein